MKKEFPSTPKRPFENLKFLIVLNKVLGLISCKLVKGRFKPSSIWSHCYCAMWILLHCAYSSVFYYMLSIAPTSEKAKTGFALSIVRYSGFFLSLLPYHSVVILRDRDFVKFSGKLEAYDDKTMALGHERKDKHIYTWLYFMYTFVTLTLKTYYAISYNIGKGAVAIIATTFESVVPIVIGTYCVFITCIFLDLVRQRFRHLNEVIVPRVSELPVTGSQGEITVYDIRYLHDVLIDSAELINILYGLGTLLTFTSILLEFVSVIYLFIQDVKEDNTLVTMLDLLFQVIYLFSMYHFTAHEANRVEERTMKYGLSFENVKCRIEKIETMLYFYHNRFTFTAAEFFILDLTILVSIASTVTTYITLII